MTEKIQDWGGSRWDYTRSQSNWHFDPTLPPVPGSDSYTSVCRFVGDYTDVIQQLTPAAKPNTWANRNLKLKEGELYCASLEEADLIRAGADPRMPIYSRAYAHDIEKFQQIAQYLGVQEPDIKFHNQVTGQMLVTHIDNFAGRAERKNSFRVTELDENPDSIRRFAIMLADWQMGQVFQLGNATWSQWRAGDCITWEWRDIPHATCNMGWWDRPMLQITGFVSDKTREILAESNKGTIVNLWDK